VIARTVDPGGSSVKHLDTRILTHDMSDHLQDQEERLCVILLF